MDNLIEEIKSNMPRFRAKKKYSKDHVVGQLLEIENQCFIIEEKQLTGFDIMEDGCFDDGMLSGHIVIQDFIYEIEKKTVSIHFPDMIANDSNRLLPNGEKDLRIFASLREDGKGGDIMEHPRNKIEECLNGVANYKKGRIQICQDGFSPRFEQLKITGIQK